MTTRRDLSRRNFLTALFASGALAASAPVGSAAPAAKKPATNSWQVLHAPPRQRRAGVSPFPANSPLENLAEFDLTGPRPGHPHMLGRFAVNGEFGIQDGLVTRIAGNNAVVRLTEGENFELEGMVNAEGLGGWFLAIGWKDGAGVMFSQIGTKQSGAPWHLIRFADGAAEKDSEEEINRFNWKGVLPLKLSVQDKTVQLAVGTTRIARDLKLREYAAGQVLLGTFDGQYGPRNVRVHSLRVRHLKAAADADAPPAAEPPPAAKKDAGKKAVSQ